MKKEYLEPDAEVIMFETMDVIRTSPVDDGNRETTDDELDLG